MAFMHFLVLHPVIFLAQQVAQPAITFEQIAPVEVVALCDVDARMLSEAASLVASRQRSGSSLTK